MDSHRIRNIIPPVYAILVVAAFFISATVGVIVVVVGAMLTGLLWSMLSGGARSGGDAGPRGDRAAARARRRSGRR